MRIINILLAMEEVLSKDVKLMCTQNGIKGEMILLFLKKMPTLDVSHLSMDYIFTGFGILANTLFNSEDGWMLRNGSVKSVWSWKGIWQVCESFKSSATAVWIKLVYHDSYSFDG
ncbi:hypothetical protein KIL84_017091 [Mauremys mutica]|uniref:Uncharacterized protein n=1 Tax=Mauremys mutica TaxID=74926 RepID=A0A9D3X5N0_9SAUR|nr:hypothetical protein KIL84_017091 [Mauremys mutica]